MKMAKHFWMTWVAVIIFTGVMIIHDKFKESQAAQTPFEAKTIKGSFDGWTNAPRTNWYIKISDCFNTNDFIITNKDGHVYISIRKPDSVWGGLLENK